MKAKIADIAKRFREEIAKCSDFDSLQTIKVKFLGKSGELTGQLKCMEEGACLRKKRFRQLRQSGKQRKAGSLNSFMRRLRSVLK